MASGNVDSSPGGSCTTTPSSVYPLIYIFPSGRGYSSNYSFTPSKNTACDNTFGNANTNVSNVLRDMRLIYPPLVTIMTNSINENENDGANTTVVIKYGDNESNNNQAERSNNDK